MKLRGWLYTRMLRQRTDTEQAQTSKYINNLTNTSYSHFCLLSRYTLEMVGLFAAGDVSLQVALSISGIAMIEIVLARTA